MSAKKLIQLIIGAAGFVHEAIDLNAEMNEVVISVRPTKHERYRCGVCRRKAK